MQSDISTTSVNVISTVSTVVPSTLVASLTRKAPMPTAQPVSTESTLAHGASGEEATMLVRVMEEMSKQATKMNKLKEKVTSLETDYQLAKNHAQG